jgi:hypothetical protein
MRQRARATRPAQQLPPTLASSGPDDGRPGHLAGPAREARDSSGRPVQGESQRDDHPPLDSSLTPTYLALVSSERLCPRDRGTPTRAQHPYSLGRPGPVTPTTAPPTGQAAPGEAGPRPTNACTRTARAAWTPPRRRRGGTGPVKRGAADSDDGNTSDSVRAGRPAS